MPSDGPATISESSEREVLNMDELFDMYKEILNDILFEHMATDDSATSVRWLGDARWMIFNSEEPAAFIVELHPAEIVAVKHD